MFNYQINKAGTQNATMLCLLEFIPEEFIAELLATNALKLSVNSIGFNNLEINEPVPYEFYSGYFEKGTEEIETDMKQTDNGPIHTTELSFFLPNDTSDQTHILNRISEHRFILKYTDRNGEIKLIGKTGNGCSLSYKYSNKRSQRGYLLTFRMESETANAHYTG